MSNVLRHFQYAYLNVLILHNNVMISNNKKETIFRFKRFSVSHGQSAMKVGTDGVLLGAWTPIDDCMTVWDVGSGSGLISLMIAQRSSAEIYGIEIDEAAATEMTENFKNSPWSNQLHAVKGDIMDAAEALPKPDLIVCNPPFFCDALPTPDAARSVARHEGTLGFKTVIQIASKYLDSDGRLAMISPTDRSRDIEWESAIAGLNLLWRVDIKTSVGKSPTRTLWLFGRINGQIINETVSLRDINNEFSPWYKNLVKDYYLNID